MLLGLLVKIGQMDYLYSRPYRHFISHRDEHLEDEKDYSLGIRLESSHLPRFSKHPVKISNFTKSQNAILTTK